MFWCVDAVLRLLGVFHDVLYGDVAPVRPGSTLGVVSVRLSRSLFVPGRHLKKGGSPPFTPLLAPTPGWPPRGGLVSAPQLPTPGWPLRERRETPPRQCTSVHVQRTYNPNSPWGGYFSSVCFIFSTSRITYNPKSR